MPNIKSAVKRMRTSEKARAQNKTVKSRVSSSRRNMFESVKTAEKEKCRKAFRNYCSTLDKAAKKGIIKKNTAIRRKRRSAAKLAAFG